MFLRKSFLFLLTSALLLIGSVFWVGRDLPSVDKVLTEGVNPTKWTQIFASDGTPIMTFGKFHHKNVKLSDVSPHFIEALLATEDRRFRLHMGVDPIAIVRAIVSDLTHKGIREGGSTLTQQLARNVFLSNERSFSRKIKEAILAFQLEERLTKDQILELYINNIYFGEGAYGIQAASEVYFNKAPSQLTIDEAALLAGLPQAPSGYSPFQNPEAAKKRRNEVLENLKEVGKLDDAKLEQVSARSFHLNPHGRDLSSSDKAPFFNRYVMHQVQRYFNLDEQSFWQSGLKIYTTLDLNAQAAAQDAVVNQSKAYGRTQLNQQAALLSLNPQTGAMLAYVGGREYQRSQFDRVSSATRSPGSLFKIFTYTTAVDRGYEPSRVYLDEPIQVGDWKPLNYDKSHHGYMTMAKALVTSNNIVAVKVINELTPDAVIYTAHQMGIKSPLEPYLGLTLGGSGVNLLEITSAFGVLANQGVRAEPYAIERITDEAGRVIFSQHPVKMDVLNRSTVDTMVKMMMGVIERGTGKAAAIGRPIAGKTGTSDDYRDAWFVGFTPSVVTGVWVGNDNNAPMPGMTGGSLPATIWRSYMRGYLSGKSVENFDLAYSKALTEADFESYDIKNLSEQEKDSKLATKEPQDPQMEQDPALQNPDGTQPQDGQYLAPLDPNTGSGEGAGRIQPDSTPGGPDNRPANPLGASPMDNPQPRLDSAPVNPAPATSGRSSGYGGVIPLDRQSHRTEGGNNQSVILMQTGKSGRN